MPRIFLWIGFGLVLTIGLAFLIAVNWVRLPLHESDKVQAVEHIVAWIVNGQPLPGFSEKYRDAKTMTFQKQFFVICDDLDPTLGLSTDAKVKRITANDYKDVFKTHGYDNTDYIRFESISQTENSIVVQLTNLFSEKGGHSYQFEFRRTIIGLRARGKLTGVI